VNFLLDTNVVSEWVKPRPDPGVIAWLSQADEDQVYLSVVTLAELRFGIERLSDGQRKRRLDEWLRNDLVDRFDGRVLAVDAAIADAWGRLVARRDDIGRPIDAMDAFIAATADAYGLGLVTRNVADFTPSVATIFNPWSRP